MKIATIPNKRRRTTLIDNSIILNIIDTTLLTVKYCKEGYVRLKKEIETASSGIIRKRCHALISNMSGAKLNSTYIDRSSRNFVDSLIHVYDNDGIDSVLTIATILGRPCRLKGHMDEIPKRLESGAPRSSAEAAHIIRDLSGISFSLTWIREIMHRCGFRSIKMQPIPGKACPQKQNEWLENLQPVIDETT